MEATPQAEKRHTLHHAEAVAPRKLARQNEEATLL
jgi:hypothetical protein